MVPGKIRSFARARRIAGETNSAVMELICSARVEMASERIETRAAGNSEATPEIATALASRQNAWDKAYRIETSQPLEVSVQKALDVWHRAI